MIKLRNAAALAGAYMAVLTAGGTAAMAADRDSAQPGADAAFALASAALSPAPSAATTAPSAAPGASGSTAPGPGSASSAAAISRAGAETIAIRAAGGGRVTDVEQETEHNRPVYDVEVLVGTVEHDVDVDRETGAVLLHGSESADDSNSDDRDDGDADDDRGQDDDRPGDDG